MVGLRKWFILDDKPRQAEIGFGLKLAVVSSSGIVAGTIWAQSSTFRPGSMIIPLQPDAPRRPC